MGIRFFTPNIPPPVAPNRIVNSRLRDANEQQQQFGAFLQAELPFEEFRPGGSLFTDDVRTLTGAGAASTVGQGFQPTTAADTPPATDPRLDLTLPGVLIDLIA